MSPRRTLFPGLLILAGLLLTGCSPAQKLVGKWQLDTSKAKAEFEKATSGNPLAGMMSGMLDSMKLEMEFKGDGNFVVGYSVLGQTGSETGSWRYVKSEGDVLVLMVKAKSDTAEREAKVRVIDSDHLEMIPPASVAEQQGKSMPFVRVKT